MNDITVVIVTYNTKELLQRAYESVRKFYPEMSIIIVDGSDKNNNCYDYAVSLQGGFTTILQTPNNVGHGRGMEWGIKLAKTKYVLLMDSDVEIQRPCLPNMWTRLENEPTAFGCGLVVHVDENGTNVDSDTPDAIPYLHPHFALISRDNYAKVPGFVHHGAPCLRTMQHLITFKKQKLIDYQVSNYIIHEGRGTRSLNPKEFLKDWE